MPKRYVAVLILIVVGVSALAADNPGFSFRTGLGYDFVSQRYFLDSLQYVGGDSILTKWALTTDYLDDVKGKFDVRFLYDDLRRLEFRSTYEQTPNLIRVKLTGDWQEEMVLGTFQWRNEIDWRDQYRDSDQPIGSYLYGLSQAKLKYPLTIGTDIWAQAQVDGVNFYDHHGYGFDYYRLGGKVGLTQALGVFSSVSLSGFFMNRQVTDSQKLDYQSFGAEGALFGAFENVDVDLLSRFEHKDYNRPDSDEDFDRLELDGRSRIRSGQNFVSRQEIEVEVAWFSPDDLLNLNYQRVSITLLGGVEFDGLEVGIGPDFEVLNESTTDTNFQSDYYELGGQLDVTYLSAPGLFGSLETSLGYRHVSFQNNLQSDFVFYRLGLLADWTLWQTINLSTLLSAEWEWHDEAGDDSRVVLLSTGLSYAF